MTLYQNGITGWCITPWNRFQIPCMMTRFPWCFFFFACFCFVTQHLTSRVLLKENKHRTEKCMLYEKFESLSSHFTLKGVKWLQFFPASRTSTCRIPQFMENDKCSQCFLLHYLFPQILREMFYMGIFFCDFQALGTDFTISIFSAWMFLSFPFTFRLLHYSLLFHFRVDIGIFCGNIPSLTILFIFLL